MVCKSVLERCWNSFILGKMIFLFQPVKIWTEPLLLVLGSLAMMVSSWVCTGPGWGLFAMSGLTGATATVPASWAQPEVRLLRSTADFWGIPEDARTLYEGAFLGRKGPKLSFLSDFKTKADGDHILCSGRLEPGHTCFGQTHKHISSWE